jgi:hypothetical protein
MAKQQKRMESFVCASYHRMRGEKFLFEYWKLLYETTYDDLKINSSRLGILLPSSAGCVGYQLF